ncbi:MAG: hypothetical protein JWO31_4049 [Phycisphaerales bacterium]|nr:hypothetical protein [Phycisphaerales bacterium]
MNRCLIGVRAGRAEHATPVTVGGATYTVPNAKAGPGFSVATGSDVGLARWLSIPVVGGFTSIPMYCDRIVA